MEKKNIGEHSGKVWHALRVVDKITIPELARKLDLSVESISLAVGWLARENQVHIRREKGIITVSPIEKSVEFSFG